MSRRRTTRLALFLLIACGAACSAPAAEPAPQAEPEAQPWQSLFDGKTLGRWEVSEEFDFRRHGKVEVADGRIVLEQGSPGTAVRLTGEFPRENYELSLRAMRVEGHDFFCGLTFPVGPASLSLIVGGWGGPVCGLSCIDGEPAAENETCSYQEFRLKQWYTIRLRVRPQRVEAWIDDRPIVDFSTAGRKLSIWFEEKSVLPLAVATWQTTGAIRNIRVRKIAPP